MKKKIDCMFIRNGNVVGFTIFDMDERFRKYGEYESLNGLRIQSMDCPEISDQVLYLRGKTREHDRDIVQMSFETKEEAKEYISRAAEALKDWAENCPAFEDDKFETESDIDNRITHVVI